MTSLPKKVPPPTSRKFFHLRRRVNIWDRSSNYDTLSEIYATQTKCTLFNFSNRALWTRRQQGWLAKRRCKTETRIWVSLKFSVYIMTIDSSGYKGQTFWSRIYDCITSNTYVKKHRSTCVRETSCVGDEKVFQRRHYFSIRTCHQWKFFLLKSCIEKPKMDVIWGLKVTVVAWIVSNGGGGKSL